ncbi:MAG TPA: hypothetical protein PLE75_08440 [Ferruginibacter sp.]|nr:hypothetical protein [Ferruginibacter sp.]HRO97732.1 hypothetical protein [Ferruginibacter sp.]
MKKIMLLGMISLFMVAVSNAQDYKDLQALNTSSLKVYYSKGYDQRTQAIAQRVQHAMGYFEQLLHSRADVTLLVLSETDWPKYTSMPVVGMPHYKNSKELVVAAHDNALWKSFIPPLNELPESLATQIKNTYKTEDGTLSMQPFFDLLAIHELGHAFHFQAGVQTQRKWMGELLVNMMLHTYIAVHEPQSLPALTVFPKMVIAGDTTGFKFTSLEDVHDRYDEIGSQHPKNYGWYQSRWHQAAAEIYDAEGVPAVQHLWNALKSQTETLSHDALITYLEKSQSTGVARMIRNW